MVMSFLVFLSSSSFVHCIIPAPCWTAGTAQTLAWNTFPAFSLDLRAGLTRIKYSVLTLLFICLWKISLYSMRPKCL